MSKKRYQGQRDAVSFILVVEDEFFIAMEIEAILVEAGYDVLGPIGSVADALNALIHQVPDAAVLDVNLRGRRVTPVAEALSKEIIPFVVASAYSDLDQGDDPLLANAINLGKPVVSAQLIAEVQRMVGASGAKH